MTITPLPLSEVIEALRAVQPPKRPVPTVAQLERIVSLIRDDGLPLAEVTARCGVPGMTEDMVLDLAAALGKYRAQVRKKDAPKAQAMSIFDAGMLFGSTSDLDRFRREAELLREYNARPTKQERAKYKREVIDVELGVTKIKDLTARVQTQQIASGYALGREEAVVLLPAGFDKDSAHGRDVEKSLAALAVDELETAEVIRFVERHLADKGVELEACHVHSLHLCIRHGLTDRLLEVAGLARTEHGIEKVGAGNIGAAGLLVQAYDLLELFRSDAMSALVRLVDEQESLQERRHAAATARWLAPGELERIERLLDQAIARPGNESLARLVATAVYNLRLRPPVLARVEDMTSAHITQVLRLAGLETDRAEQKAIEAELRTRLKELGLGNDLDQEIPEGVRAWRSGRLEAFYASRQARVEGDPDWKSLYVTAEAHALA